MKKISSVIGLIIIFALFSAGFFYVGMKYGSSKSMQRGQNFQQIGLKNGSNPMQNKGGLIAGDIIAKDDKSITVKLIDGSSKIIFLSDNVQINKAAVGTINDLEIGSTVSVSGTNSQDGSVIAQLIQLRSLEEKSLKNSLTPVQ
ncbi:MAG: hypothetical protein WC303_00255 [Candidatus Paceibacterota bacterium]|jgi:hypothetical protein